MYELILLAACIYLGIGVPGAGFILFCSRPVTRVECIGAMLLVVLWPLAVLAMFRDELKK